VIPRLRYRRAAAAIERLCDTLGFRSTPVVPSDGNAIAHARLTHGAGMIMLASTTDAEFGRLMRQPDEVGGAETQSLGDDLRLCLSQALLMPLAQPPGRMRSSSV